MVWTQRVHDTFTDTEGTALASHTPDQGSSWNDVQVGCHCSVGLLKGTNNNNVSLNNTSLTDTQAAELTIADKNGQPFPVILAAWDGSNLTGYKAYFFVNVIIIDKYTGSGFSTTNIASGSVVAVNGDVV